MACAASRNRSVSRIACRTNLLCAALSVSLLAAATAQASEPTKPTDSTTSAPKATGEPVKIDTGLVQGVAAE